MADEINDPALLADTVSERNSITVYRSLSGCNRLLLRSFRSRSTGRYDSFMYKRDMISKAVAAIA